MSNSSSDTELKSAARTSECNNLSQSVPSKPTSHRASLILDSGAIESNREHTFLVPEMDMDDVV